MAELYITAFGSFEGFDRNPSEDLLEDVVVRCNKGNSNDLWELIGHHVLPVSAKEVQTWLNENLYGDVFRRSHSHPVVVHMGVDSEATSFRLETYAANEATFRMPDKEGWQPQHEEIDVTCPLTSKLMTDLPVSVVAGLLQARGAPVEQSFNAGRYVCNWTYYHSLARASFVKPKPHVIFLHVPPVSAMPLEQQREVLWQVLCEIAGAVVGGPQGADDPLRHVEAGRLPSILRALRS